MATQGTSPVSTTTTTTPPCSPWWMRQSPRPRQVPMGSWNYRLVSEPDSTGHGEPDEIRMIEAYYDDEDNLHSWCYSDAPRGESREEVRADAQHMVEACGKQIIPWAELPGIRAIEEKLAQGKEGGT